MNENIATATATIILSAEDAAALATGVASNVFGVPVNEGFEPLSLPAEGKYPTFEAAKEATNHHAMLAGYAMTQGGRTYENLGREIELGSGWCASVYAVLLRIIFHA